MNRLIRYTNPRVSLFRGPAFQNSWSGLESEINHLFESALADIATPSAPRFPVDLYEDKDNVYVRAELPGVNRDAISLEMVDGYLSLNATRKTDEQSFNYTRSIVIPEAVQADRVSATLEHGVLTVTLPKQEQAKPRKIAISVS
ncbi:MAG: Hsp20/alpha crystallin family protein [Candidatus Didemnitutus sp.]|nr:Hsp20/alpha crystallin family protein [Candidatus Didemnitutus sp.]